MWQLLEQFFTRLFQGSKISFLSFKAYFSYKKLIMIPILSACVFTAILTLAFGIFFKINPIIETLPHHQIIGAIIFVVPLLFLASFNSAFFKTVTTYMVSEYCNTHRSSLGHARFTKALPIRIRVVGTEQLSITS